MDRRNLEGLHYRPRRQCDQAQAGQPEECKANRYRVDTCLPEAMQNAQTGVAPCEIDAQRGVVTHDRKHDHDWIKHRGLLHEMGVVVGDPIGFGGHLRFPISPAGARRHLSQFHSGGAKRRYPARH